MSSFGLFDELKTRLVQLRDDTTKAFNHISLISPIDQFQSAFDTVINELQLEKPLNSSNIQSSLDLILDVLLKEQAKNTNVVDTGVCMDYFLENQLLEKLVTLSEVDLAYRATIIKFSASLVAFLEPHLLYNSVIHAPLTRLTNDQRLSDELIELEYYISIKIFESIELLNLFLSNHKNESKIEFPIFDHLIQYIHLDTELGEFSRASFEMLLTNCLKSDLEKYILQTEFSSIIIASLSGLFAQLPHVLPGIERQSRRAQFGNGLLQEFDNDLNAFTSFYKFLQSCVRQCVSDTVKKDILSQFTTFFLGQVVLSSINSCSDFDGSTITSLFYLQTMLDLTTEESMIVELSKFILSSEDESDDISTLRTRDILLSKLNSLSEDVVVSVIQILSNLLSNHSDITLTMLIEKCPKNPKTPQEVNIQDHMSLISQYLPLLPKGTSSTQSNLDTYLSDAISTLLTRHNQPKKSEVKDQQKTTAEKYVSPYEKISLLRSDPTLMKLLNKVQSFYSHSMKINIALTGIITLLATQPNPILFQALFDPIGIPISSESNPIPTTPITLLSIFTNLLSEYATYQKQIPNFEMRMLLLKQHMIDNSQPEEFPTEDLNHDLEILKNCVCLEEFIKEIVACMMMRGGSPLEVISYA
ncbi:Retinoic acid induced 16-like protein-domain-containing protein [Globomyces pollinis-pini]|nr:Retinoic acid induced 16-like protein-domain-containing protein [Globomyces pollinis-pini]